MHVKTNIVGGSGGDKDTNGIFAMIGIFHHPTFYHPFSFL
jgi:hypothetical protein